MALDIETLEWTLARLLAAQSEIELSKADGIEVEASHVIGILIDEVMGKLSAGRDVGVGETRQH